MSQIVITATGNAGMQRWRDSMCACRRSGPVMKRAVGLGHNMRESCQAFAVNKEFAPHASLLCGYMYVQVCVCVCVCVCAGTACMHCLYTCT